MQIKAKTPVDVVGLSIKRNGAHDGREAHIDLEVGIKHADAASRFGDDFAALAFATMRTIKGDEDDDDAGDKIGFLADDIKPGKNMIYELHTIRLDGDEISAQPELLKISTVDGEARVIAKLRIPVDVSKAALLATLTQKVGKTVTAEFSPSQGQFEFSAKEDAGAANGKGRKGKAKAVDAAEAH